jgi:hypothetical protein
MTVAARRWWPLAAGLALGILVGVLVSLLGSTTRKAEAKVLVSSPAGTSAVRPQLSTLRELATSGVVAGNVRSTLRLSESTEELRRHLDADVQSSSEVIKLSATDSDAEKARQVAQEAAVVFAQLVGARFGTSTPELHAAVLDSAHVLAGPDRHFIRNALIGALVGVLLGAAAFYVLAGEAKHAPVVPADDPGLRERERMLDERVKGITARERALAERAGQLAAQARDLEEREAALAEAQPAAAAPPPEPEPEPEPAPEPKPESTPEPEPVPVPPRVVYAGAWNVSDLQRAVDAQSDVSREQAEEWRAYLFFLRGHAAVDGSLPRQFDGLIEDVFGEMLDRRPSAEA